MLFNILKVIFENNNLSYVAINQRTNSETLKWSTPIKDVITASLT